MRVSAAVRWSWTARCRPAARDTLHFARDTAGTLLRKAAEHVREAKRIHDELEALCSPYVDFAAADALTERTLHELVSGVKKRKNP